MRTAQILATALFAHAAVADDAPGKKPPPPGTVTKRSGGLHGYIGFTAQVPPLEKGYGYGVGFYSAIWPLVDEPIADFQIGLPSTWITPNNSDNTTQPLAPKGTYARDHWPERGPTYEGVFQTVEGGPGYWAGNRFRYGPPKFSMNSTPQCYDYELASPGWEFFRQGEALRDDRLGVAQLSNRLLIPPDGLPFASKPNGQFLGYTWMALPFTEPTGGDFPTGDQSWTCFLDTGNFKGPIAFYIPETWSKIAKRFNYPFLNGRGLDARQGDASGSAMEINSVPRFDSTDAKGVVYTKIPKLQFPVDDKGRSYLVQDVKFYSKSALYDAFKAMRDGGEVCNGVLDKSGTYAAKLTTRTTRYDQGGVPIRGVKSLFDNAVFEDNVWGLQWADAKGPGGLFPQYFRSEGKSRVAVAEADVPTETKLQGQKFPLAKPGRKPYTSPTSGAWAEPGPKLGPFTVDLVDGSVVTYSWYRFVDQPSFQQYKWGDDKKAKLQSLVEKLHANWPIDRNYMGMPTRGELVKLDPALIVTPPKGLEVGYVPIVTRQAAK